MDLEHPHSRFYSYTLDPLRLFTMINIPSTFKISFRALRVNKMRSALTMLGIIIGVGAVIAMVAVGTGASQKIAAQISSMGSNLLIILPGARRLQAVSEWEPARSPRFPWAMPMRSSEGVPAVSDVAPTIGRRGTDRVRPPELVHGRHGTTPGFLNVRDWDLTAEGRSRSRT